MKLNPKSTLYHPILGVREFTEQEAQTIMAMPDHKRGGWQWYTGQDDEAEQSQENISTDAVIDPGHKEDLPRGKRRRKGDAE